MFTKRILLLPKATLQGAKFTPRMFYHDSVKPLQDFANDFNRTGRLFDAEFKFAGSGVYIDGLVISAAHCFSKTIGDTGYFTLGNDQPVKIIHVIKHPLHEQIDFEHRRDQGQNDIAVALLEKKIPIVLPELQIEYNLTEVTDCISVGYPQRYAIRQEDDSRIRAEPYIPFSWEETRPLGVIASCYHSTDYPNCLEHTIGYKKSQPGKYDETKYDGLDSGLLPGMSGGGLFTRKDKKLIGINVAGQGIPGYSNLSGSRNFFNPLARHHAFLENSMNELKNTRKR